MFFSLNTPFSGSFDLAIRNNQPPGSMTEIRKKTLGLVIYFAEEAKLVYYKKDFKKQVSEGCPRENDTVMLSADLQKGKFS